MNLETAAFLGSLAQTVPEENFALLLRGAMEREYTARFGGLPDREACYSQQAKEARQQLDACYARMERAAGSWEAVDLQREVEKLTVQVRSLCEETAALVPPGAVFDWEKVHFVFPADWAALRDHAQHSVEAELFRVLTLGGVESFRSLPALKDTSLKGLFLYEQQILRPIQKTLPQCGAWAVENRPVNLRALQCTVSLFVPAAPDRARIQPPGRAVRGGTTVYPGWQGRGLLTNVTPANILTVQQQGVADRLRDKEVVRREDTTPTGYLNRMFAGQLYAIRPEQLFAHWNEGQIRNVLLTRSANHQCLLCGQETAGERQVIGRQCIRKMQKL